MSLGVGLLIDHARAQGGTRYSVDIQAVFDRSGDPLLVANFAPDGSLAIAHWMVCRPGEPCRVVPSRDGDLRAGPEPAGTRLIARAVYRGRTYSASRTWRGRVRAVTSPSATGRLQADAVLHLTAARWVGGWGDETDQLGAEACTTRNARNCRMLAGGELGCPDASPHRRLGGWFTDAYVFALDARQPKDEFCAGTGYFSNADLPLWHLAPTVIRSTALGRIAGPARPTVKILPRADILRGRALVATIRCLARCHVAIEVSDGTSGALGAASFTGTRRVGVPRLPLASGSLTVRIHVDDGPVIGGRSRL